MSVNKVILLGKLGKDPELRNVNGKNVVNFSIATSKSYKDKTTGEKKESTEWHNIVIWGALADVASKYLHKGDQVYLEGWLRTRSWEKQGVTVYATEVLVDNMNLLGSKTQASSQPAAKPQQQAAKDDDFSSDDLPF
jgi:single-strand DNA-binding protein